MALIASDCATDIGRSGRVCRRRRRRRRRDHQVNLSREPPPPPPPPPPAPAVRVALCAKKSRAGQGRAGQGGAEGSGAEREQSRRAEEQKRAEQSKRRLRSPAHILVQRAVHAANIECPSNRMALITSDFSNHCILTVGLRPCRPSWNEIASAGPCIKYGLSSNTMALIASKCGPSTAHITVGPAQGARRCSSWRRTRTQPWRRRWARPQRPRPAISSHALRGNINDPNHLGFWPVALLPLNISRPESPRIDSLPCPWRPPPPASNVDYPPT